MHKILVYFFLLFFFFQFSSFAQLRYDPSPEEIAKAKNIQRKFADDKDVNVVLIEGKETVEFKPDRKTKKLFVFKENEDKFMNIKDRSKIVKYVFYDSNSEVKKMKVYYKNGKKNPTYINDEYFKVDDLFYHDNRVKYLTLHFPMLGYQQKFKYKKIYKDPKYFTNLFFTDDEPILKKTFEFIIPKDVNVELVEKNFKGFDIEKKQHFDSEKNANIITYTVKNLSGHYNESHMQGRTYIYPHILVLIHSYKDKEGQTHKVFENTGDLYAWYHSLIKQLKENPAVLKPKVKSLTKNAKNDIEKIKNIFYWVQDNIRYIAFEDGLAGYKPDESQNVFEKRYGDCKGMANLLTAMLKQAGFDARRTWLGTRRIAYDYSTPNLAVDNHMICTLFLNGKPYYLDATETYIPFDEYAERIQGREVLIEDGEKYMLKKVPVHNASHNKQTYHKHISLSGDKLTGHVSETFKGQSRTAFLQLFNSINTDIKKDVLQYYIKGDDGNLTISNIKKSDFNDRESNVNLDYDIVLNNAVSNFDNELYVDLDYKKAYGNLDFEKRQTPYQFYQKVDNELVTVLDFPNDYKISELPEELHVDNEDFKVDISFLVKGNQLTYKRHFVFPNALIKKRNLKEWQKVYQKLNDIYQTQLTLIKK